MEERTLKEKAKSFKEALSRAKGFYKRFPEYKEILEKIFPELKESEDERIRQLLIRFVAYDMSDNYSDDFTPADCVAWLEKQGKNNMGISEATKKKLEDNLNKALEKETPESFNEFLDEQKSAWSEEDEEALEVAIIALEDMYSKDSPLDCYAGHHMTFDKAANQLKSLKGRVQPKQELSEEDKCIVTELIGIFESAVDGGYVDIPYRLIKDYIRVLKSCLPQTTWKPSDDEMKALAEALSLANNCGEEYAFDLRTLQDQLKKLK